MNADSRNYYILIASDTHSFLLTMPSAYEIALYRLNRGEWGINSHTNNRKTLKPNDEAIIYISGRREHRLSFVAAATIASYSQTVPFNNRLTVDAPRETGVILSEYSILLKNIRIFPTKVAIKEIMNKLSFIKDPTSKKWGTYVRGGVRRIQKKDYNLILKKQV